MEESQHQQRDFSFENALFCTQSVIQYNRFRLLFVRYWCKAKIFYFYSKIGGLSQPIFVGLFGFKIKFFEFIKACLWGDIETII